MTRLFGWKRERLGGSVAALVLLAGAVAGCSSAEEQSEPATAESPSETALEGGSNGDPSESDAEGASAALAEAAREEGEVVIYGAPTEATIRGWVEPFEEEFGVSVNYFRTPSNPLHQRWSQETEAGQHTADMIMTSLPLEVVAADERGWVAEFSPDDAGAYDETYSIPNKAYPLYLSIDVIGWNANEVTDEEKERLRSEKLEAFDETWAGRLALTDMRAGGSQLANYQQLIDVRSDEYGWEFLEGIAELEPVIYDSSVALSERLIAGEHAASFTLPATIAASQVLAGAPIEWTYRENPTAGMFMIATSENAPNPNAARTFMNWALSLEGQEALVNSNQGVSVHEDWVDERPITEQEWYEPYEGEVYVDWAFDTELAERAPEYYERYTTVFGLSD